MKHQKKEKKNKADTMLDQLDDIKKRKELNVQNIDEFKLKYEELK